MDVGTVVSIGTTILREINDNNELKRLLFGTYSNGKPRSLADAVGGEFMSPKERANKHNKKKKGKGNKYKKKYNKLKKKPKKSKKQRKKYKYKYVI